MQKPSGAHSFRRYDWDAIAGIAAAVAALILHLFHVVQLDILITIPLVLVALLLLRQLRHEEREEPQRSVDRNVRRAAHGRRETLPDVAGMNTAVRSKMRPSAAIEDEGLPGLVQNRDLTLFPDRRRPHSANGRDRHVERPR
jgi:choline-glycine betaine transporter